VTWKRTPCTYWVLFVIWKCVPVHTEFCLWSENVDLYILSSSVCDLKTCSLYILSSSVWDLKTWTCTYWVLLFVIWKRAPVHTQFFYLWSKNVQPVHAQFFCLWSENVDLYILSSSICDLKTWTCTCSVLLFVIWKSAACTYSVLLFVIWKRALCTYSVLLPILTQRTLCNWRHPQKTSTVPQNINSFPITNPVLLSRTQRLITNRHSCTLQRRFALCCLATRCKENILDRDTKK
jgi:hypothetical protein